MAIFLIYFKITCNHLSFSLVINYLYFGMFYA